MSHVNWLPADDQHEISRGLNDVKNNKTYNWVNVFGIPLACYFWPVLFLGYTCTDDDPFGTHPFCILLSQNRSKLSSLRFLRPTKSSSRGGSLFQLNQIQPAW